MVLLYITIFFISSLDLSSFQHICAARDVITRGSSFSYIQNDTLVSAGQRFQLGFFRPPKSPKHGIYIAISYSMDPQTVVWIANRDKPLSDVTGTFVIGEDGDLEVLDGNNNSYFSTNISSSQISPQSSVKLLDSGNLVLSDDQSGEILWQSFNNPTDTFLPGMKMDDNLKLTSRISDEDPRSGNFVFQQDPDGENRFIIVSNGSNFYWKSKDTGTIISSTEMFSEATFLLSNFSRPEDPRYQKKNSGDKDTGSISYKSLVRGQDYNNTRLLMNATGEIQFFSWNNETWHLEWSAPRDRCSVYNTCGDFGICSSTSKPMCKCLRNFEPSAPHISVYAEISNGCKRKSSQSSTKSTFLNLMSVKVKKPDLPKQAVESKKRCEEMCLENPQCQAYTCTEGDKTKRMEQDQRNSTSDCWIWTSNLCSLREDTEGGHNLSVRVFIPDKEVKETNQAARPQNQTTSRSLKPVVIFIIVIVVVLLLCSIIGYISYRRTVMIRRGSKESTEEAPGPRLYDNERCVKDLINSSQFEEDDNKSIDVPYFNLESILAATDNFSSANKLGEGGFGPVYKGKFPRGQEIAVKRLSSHSGQGLNEFKNEVVLIAKLQHRNLVRLLGYCIRGYEKILLYEYMPNKSLDAFIFDQSACVLLDWETRFDIILGIARGLLYLHEDSRLRVIHRDLKTSNILLDEEMNPKISDFGLARIVGGKETEANTNKVVGTYGYMSPEYALEGSFSIKSDVFSFGVVVLEIISGKRNTGFYRSELALNVLGYAWRLWREERSLDLMDRALLELCNKSEVLKCIIIGLLCVQEDPGDRPTMSTVVFMLGSEISTLPNPKQPAFVLRKSLSTTPYSSSSKPDTLSNNELTVTIEKGR